MKSAIEVSLIVATVLFAVSDSAHAGGAIACEPEPTDMTIDYGDVVTCGIDTVGDSDIFRFNADIDEKVVVVASWVGGGLPCIEPFTPQGSSLGTTCSFSGARVDLEIGGNPGLYTVLVTESNNDATVDYALTLERVTPPSPGATSVCYGCTLTESLAPIGDFDPFSFEGVSGEKIRLVASWLSGGLPCVEMYDPDGNPLDDACSFFGATIELTLPVTGTYFALVSEANSDSIVDYALALERINPSSPDSAPISFGDTLGGSIDPIGDIDTFHFIGSPGEKIRLVASWLSGGLPCLELFDPTGDQLGDVCSFSGATVELTLLSSGTYSILITEANSDSTVDYALTLERIAPLWPGSTLINPGVTLGGNIEPIGEIDSFYFLGTAGDAITLVVAWVSGGLPCVELFSPSGERVGDDCSFSGATISMNLADSGFHTIFVSEANSDSTVEYTLSYQCIVGACVVFEPMVFQDGFETGDTSAWSSAVP